MLSAAFTMILYSLLLKLYGSRRDRRVPSAVEHPRAAARRGLFGQLNITSCWPSRALAVYVAYRVTASPLGYLMRAIYDNEIRVEYMGASVRRTIYRTYLLSARSAGSAAL